MRPFVAIPIFPLSQINIYIYVHVCTRISLMLYVHRAPPHIVKSVQLLVIAINYCGWYLRYMLLCIRKEREICAILFRIHVWGSRVEWSTLQRSHSLYCRPRFNKLTKRWRCPRSGLHIFYIHRCNQDPRILSKKKQKTR